MGNADSRESSNCNKQGENKISLRFIVRNTSGSIVLSRNDPTNGLFDLTNAGALEGMFETIISGKNNGGLKPTIGSIVDFGRGCYLRGCLDLRVGAHSSSQCAAIFLLESVSVLYGNYVYVLAFEGIEPPDVQDVMRSVLGNYRVG